jgi:hypothetical protein
MIYQKIVNSLRMKFIKLTVKMKSKIMLLHSFLSKTYNKSSGKIKT